jgi:hypothetical protein
MTGLIQLWLPILLSAVLVFFVSSLIHMLSPWHKTDYAPVPNEDQVRNALRPFSIPPGDYLVPRPVGREQMKSPEFAQKMNEGPNMVLTVWSNGPPSLARPLVGWFIYLIVVGIFAGYVAGRALPPGSPYLQVFRFVGTTAFIGLTMALWQMSIWYRRSWSTTIKSTIDGLIYALLMGGVFGWLWPT